MVTYKSTDLEAIKASLEDQPSYKHIRLFSLELGDEVTGFNSARENRMEHYVQKIVPYITSNATPAGKYTIEGKLKPSGNVTKIVVIDKLNGGIAEPVAVPAPAIAPLSAKEIAFNNKIAANADLIEQNAELRHKCYYLENQVKELSNKIEAMQVDMDDLEADLEEATKTKAPMLSENIQIIKELAQPFMPLAEALAAHFAGKLMAQEPAPPPQQPTEVELKPSYPLDNQHSYGY